MCIDRSDTPQQRPRRKLLEKRLSPRGRSGRRWALSRNQRNWFAAIAGATIWLRVSSSGGIVDAASVLVNATDLRHLRGRRRSRNSSIQVCGKRAGSEGCGPFSVLSHDTHIARCAASSQSLETLDFARLVFRLYRRTRFFLRGWRWSAGLLRSPARRAKCKVV